MNIPMIADTLAAVSYFNIALYLYYYWYKKKKHLPQHITLFALAMTLFFRSIICGVRAFDIVNYEQLAFLASISAFFACYVALTILKFITYFVHLKLPSEYQQEIDVVREELLKENEINKLSLKQLVQDNKELVHQVQHLQDQMKLQKWIEEKEVDLDKMKSAISALRK